MITGRAAKPKIGLIVSTLMKDEFNDFTATRPAAMEKVALLRKVLGGMGEVVCLGLTETPDDADQTRRRFLTEEVDAVIYTALSYNKGLVAARAMLNTDTPLLVWNTQHSPSLSGQADFDLMWTNSGLAGIPELCHTLIRAEKPFEFVTGQMEDAETHRKIRGFLEVALIRSRLRNSKIATIGQVYPGMTDFMTDNFDLYRRLGPICLPVDPGLIAEEMEKVDRSAVESLVSDSLQRYRVKISDRRTIQHSAALALAMEKVICRDFGAAAAAVLDQIWMRDPRIGVAPTFGYMHLYRLGVPCTNEVDVATCAALLILQHLAGKSALAEFFDMDFQSDSVILCHDTNGNPAMAAPGAEILLTEAPLYAGVHGRGVTCEFLYPEGEVTLLSLAQLPTGWKMIAAEGESIKVENRSIGAPFLKFRARGKTLAEFCQGWCTAGSTHHMAFAYGRWSEQVGTLARMMGVEFVGV